MADKVLFFDHGIYGWCPVTATGNVKRYTGGELGDKVVTKVQIDCEHHPEALWVIPSALKYMPPEKSWTSTATQEELETLID